MSQSFSDQKGLLCSSVFWIVFLLQFLSLVLANCLDQTDGIVKKYYQMLAATLSVGGLLLPAGRRQKDEGHNY